MGMLFTKAWHTGCFDGHPPFTKNETIMSSYEL